MNIEQIWDNIEKNEGSTFRQKRGKEFQYTIADSRNSLKLSTTNQTISKKLVQQALAFLPLSDTTPLQHLRAPSYLFAILVDLRIVNIQ